MKKFMKMITGVSMCALTLASCNNGGGSSVHSNGVSTGLTMTGSGHNAVAQTRFDKLMSTFIPTAYALTPAPLFDANNLAVSLSEAWVVVKEVEFEAQEVAGGAETDGDEVEFQGPYYVDLLSDAPVSFGTAVVPATGIRRIKMQLHKADNQPVAAPVGLTGNSIYFSGTVNGVAFSYSADDSTELEIAGPNAILPSNSMDMLAVIRMADLFKKIDLSSIAAPTDISSSNRVPAVNPCPSIDASANDLYDCFRKGISTEANFGNDDGDKDLGPEDETVE